MKSLLTIENEGVIVKRIGIYRTQEALDEALSFFDSSLKEGEYFAVTPLGQSEPEDVRTYMSALEIAELDYDNEHRDY